MKRCHPGSNTPYFTFGNADTVTVPVDHEIEGQYAIRINENRNAAGGKTLVEAVREVAEPTRAKNVVAPEHVIEVLKLRRALHVPAVRRPLPAPAFRVRLV